MIIRVKSQDRGLVRVRFLNQTKPEILDPAQSTYILGLLM